VVLLVVRYSVPLLRFLGRFGPFNPIADSDRFIVRITQTQLIRPIALCFGLLSCLSFRLAYLGLPSERLLRFSNMGLALTIFVRISADVYVAWIAKIELVASGRPYKFMEFWGAELVLLDIILCIVAGLPLWVSVYIWRGATMRNQEAKMRIETTPNVCGGEPCIAGTRIPIWVLEQARRLGMQEDKILKAYPKLNADDLDAARAYARAHLAEIDEQIRENESA